MPLHDRRSHCWNITGCGGEERDNCFAFIKRTNCWEIWGHRPASQKGCCKKLADCKQCPVFLANARPAIVLNVSFGLPPELAGAELAEEAPLRQR